MSIGTLVEQNRTEQRRNGANDPNGQSTLLPYSRIGVPRVSPIVHSVMYVPLADSEKTT